MSGIRPKRKRKDVILDKLHRGVVNVCIAATVLGFITLGYRVYDYYMYVKPKRIELAKILEQELLSEGKDWETLLREHKL